MAALKAKTVRKAGNLWIEDENLSPPNSLWNTCPLAAIAHEPHLASVYENDFFTFTTGEEGLASTIINTGSAGIFATAAGYHGGVLELTPSDGSVADNDETYIGSENKQWILAAGKDLWLEWWLKFAEANTDDANIVVGLSSLYNENFLIDNGAGPSANYHGITLFKVDGGTVWQAETSAGASQATSISVATRKSGVWQRLGIHVIGTEQVDFYIDGIAVASHTTYLPTASMGLVAGVKNGDTNEEKLYLDKVKAVHMR